VRAHLLAKLNETTQARDAFTRAIGLTESAALRAYLIGRQSGLP